MKLSNNFKKQEAEASKTASAKGISNKLTVDAAISATTLAHKILQPIRDKFGVVVTSSWFRSKNLNEAINGAANSKHCLGEAVDIDRVGTTPLSQVFCWIRSNLEFDQLIWELGNDEEPDWIHVSYTLNSVNRGEVLKAYKDSNGKTKYANYK